MLYKPCSFVSPGYVTLVSTFVASTLTPEITAPLGSVTRPVNVAVGPARSTLVTWEAASKINKTDASRGLCRCILVFSLAVIAVPDDHDLKPQKTTCST